MNLSTIPTYLSLGCIAFCFICVIGCGFNEFVTERFSWGGNIPKQMRYKLNVTWRKRIFN